MTEVSKGEVISAVPPRVCVAHICYWLEKERRRAEAVEEKRVQRYRGRERVPKYF